LGCHGQRAIVGSTATRKLVRRGFWNRSCKPHGCSHATSEATENAILALRSKHPSWGARKLKARLEKVQPRVN
jgi:hypothetical protein